MSDRLLKVNSVVQQALGEIFTRELEPPSSFLISISKVDTGGDLRTANVYLSVLPFSKSEEGLAFIIRHKKDLQRALGRAVKLQFTPRMTFLIDDTQERVSNIDRIIDEANRES
jgi:ribosome-binding factor A